MRAATPSHRPVGLMPDGIKLSPPECFEGASLMENQLKSL